jgi:hypothetical protein
VQGFAPADTPTTTGNQKKRDISNEVTKGTFLMRFDNTEEMILLAALSGCIMRASSRALGTPGQLFLHGIQEGEKP